MTLALNAADDRIPWQPLEAMPDDLKDGRDTLLWTAGQYPAVCSWDGAWYDSVGHEVRGATHFADVVGPEEDR